MHDSKPASGGSPELTVVAAVGIVGQPIPRILSCISVVGWLLHHSFLHSLAIQLDIVLIHRNRLTISISLQVRGRKGDVTPEPCTWPQHQGHCWHEANNARTRHAVSHKGDIVHAFGRDSVVYSLSMHVLKGQSCRIPAEVALYKCTNFLKGKSSTMQCSVSAMAIAV